MSALLAPTTPDTALWSPTEIGGCRGMSSREQPRTWSTTRAPRHTFDPALRGYDKRQVDQFVADVEHPSGRSAAERDNASPRRDPRRLGGDDAVVAGPSSPSCASDRCRSTAPRSVTSARWSTRCWRWPRSRPGTIIGAANQRASSREAESERLLNEVRDRAANHVQRPRRPAGPPPGRRRPLRTRHAGRRPRPRSPSCTSRPTGPGPRPRACPRGGRPGVPAGQGAERPVRGAGPGRGGRADHRGPDPRASRSWPSSGRS